MSAPMRKKSRCVTRYTGTSPRPIHLADYQTKFPVRRTVRHVSFTAAAAEKKTLDRSGPNWTDSLSLHQLW